MKKDKYGWNQLLGSISLFENPSPSIRIEKINWERKLIFGVLDPESPEENFILHNGDGEIYQRING